MSELKKIVKEQIQLREQGFSEIDTITHQVTIVGAKFFIVCKNGEIHHSDFDKIMERTDIEFAIIFPKISYKPNSIFTESYLKAITVNSEWKASNGVLLYNDWTVYFYDQNLNNQQRPIEIWIKNIKIDFSEHIYNISIEQFHLHLSILFLLLKCSSKEKADFIFNYYKKDETIYQLEQEKYQLIRDYRKMTTSSKHELKT